MHCDIEAKQVFHITLDMQALSTIERALSFFTERAILADGDPAKDLSRQFTQMLLRLATGKDASGGASLPPAAAEVPAIAGGDEDAAAPSVGSEAAPQTDEEPNPLEAELESMMGDRPPLPPADAETSGGA